MSMIENKQIPEITLLLVLGYDSFHSFYLFTVLIWPMPSVLTNQVNICSQYFIIFCYFLLLSFS